MDRQQVVTALKQEEPFDLLVIGGGATGCGVTVDAAARGLKVAMIEKLDIAEGTSSRSTKLVHGGVRYLEKAVMHLDRAQYDLVKEGLHERGVLLKNAPHLSNRIAFITPIYNWIDVPKIYAGLKMYDYLSGRLRLGSSKLLSRSETLKRFPSIKADGLKASILYYDGQFNDARMAVSLARTAQQFGAVIGTRIEVLDLYKEEGKVRGALVRDNVTGEEWTVKARGVINATGPFGDSIRKMDDPNVVPVITASSGIHIVMDKKFAPPANGLMIPKTEDGRVLFVLPWQGHALIGTTDDPSEIVDHPPATDSEIDYLLRHVCQYFNITATRDDIQSVWSGLRPLVSDPTAADTSNLVRDHTINMSDNGLLTIVGGKWTSYRRMAEDTVDQAVAGFYLNPPKPCSTNHLFIVGGANYKENGHEELAKKYGFDSDTCYHLNRAYGDQAPQIAELSKNNLSKKLHASHPFIEAEVLFAARYEFACHAIDVLTRRLSLSLIDRDAALSSLPRVVEIMAAELGWSSEQCEAETKLAQERLNTAL